MLSQPPKTRFAPSRIAPETFVIHDHSGEGHAPVSVALNTMVIRWVFISHDDVDHTGNVNALMAAAPNATLVINWCMTERMGASLDVAPRAGGG